MFQSVDNLGIVNIVFICFVLHLFTQMNVLKLEQREEVIVLIEKQLKEQHDLAKENIDPVSFFSGIKTYLILRCINSLRYINI